MVHLTGVNNAMQSEIKFKSLFWHQETFLLLLHIDVGYSSGWRSCSWSLFNYHTRNKFLQDRLFECILFAYNLCNYFWEVLSQWVTRHDCTLCVYMCVTGHLSERRWVCWVVGEEREGVTTHDNSVFCCKDIRSCVCSFTESINQARLTEKTEQETSRRRCDYRNTVPQTGERQGTEREHCLALFRTHRDSRRMPATRMVYPSITHTQRYMERTRPMHARAKAGRQEGTSGGKEKARAILHQGWAGIHQKADETGHFLPRVQNHTYEWQGQFFLNFCSPLWQQIGKNPPSCAGLARFRYWASWSWEDVSR